MMNLIGELSVGAGVVIFLVIGANTLFEYECKSKADVMNKRVKYGLIAGCMIEHKTGDWVPIGQYRVVD